MLRLITFDVNNTLLKFTQGPGEIYAQIAAQYGHQCDPAQLGIAFRKTYKVQYAKSPTFGSGQEDWKDWWKCVVLGTLQLSEPSLKTEHQQAIAKDLLEFYSRGSAYTALPYAKETLQCLSKKSVLLGIISNTDPRIHQVLKEHSFIEHLTFVLDAYTAGFSKPDSAIFERACHEAGLPDLKAKEALHVGDSLVRDYIGAREAGMQSMLVTYDYKEQCSFHGVPVDPKSMFPSLRDFLSTILVHC